MDPKDVVRTGYDQVSHAYRGDDDEDEQYADWLSELAALVPAKGDVLDLGCGNGIPAARWLASRGFRVYGIDFSSVMIERARTLVPEATFECTDMTSLDLPPASLDAVVAFYSLIHVPVEEQPELLARIASWLRPAGYAMLVVGVGAWTGTEDDWLGAMMYWSHADRETYLAWLTEAGFLVEWDRFVPEGDGGHTLVLARAGEK
jgi:SAM-dependent methyltransferase